MNKPMPGQILDQDGSPIKKKQSGVNVSLDHSIKGVAISFSESTTGMAMSIPYAKELGKRLIAHAKSAQRLQANRPKF